MEKALTMSKKKETREYSILPVPSPPTKFRARITMYDDIIQDTLKMDKGYYKITIPNKLSMSIFVALQKRIKRQNLSNLRVHIIKDVCYLEVT